MTSHGSPANFLANDASPMGPASEGTSRWKAALGGVTVLVVAGACFLTAARFDPEPYHDGAQVAPAIAVSHGMAIHSQAFDAYGPINAWLQGGAMVVFGRTALTARFTSALLLVVAALLVFAIVRRVTGSRVFATLAGVAWVVAWPGQAVSWGTPLLPWPSIPFLVAQLAAALFLIRRVTGPRRPWESLACGFFIAVAACTRINYGVVLAIAAMAVLLLAPEPVRMRRREWIWGLTGAGAFLFVFLIGLAAGDSLHAFWDQAIFGALVEHGLSQRSPLVYWASAYLLGSVPLFLGLLVPVLYPAHWPRPRLVIVGSAVLAVTALTIWTTTALIDSPLRDLILARMTWAPGLDGQAAQFQFLAAILTVLLAATAAIMWFIALLSRRRKSGGMTFLPNEASSPERRRAALTFVVLGATALASLAQLYPIGDPNHLWWAVPLPLAFVCFSLTALIPRFRRASIIAILFVPYILVSVLTTWTYYSKPRTVVSDGIFQGMYIPSELAPNVGKAAALFTGLGPHSTRFLCDQGAYAVWNSDYASSSARYVQWAFHTDSAEQESTPPDTVIFCTPVGDPATAEAYAAKYGYHIESITPDVTLSYFANNDIAVLRRNS